MYHHSTGKLIYDPHRPGMKNRTQWWCVVMVDREITRYYRWWIERNLHIKGLHQPSWNAHISVLRGEKPEDDLMHLWGKYNKQIIHFDYSHYPKRSHERKDGGHYWIVEVDCPKLIQIREELNRPTNWKLHLTVGRTYY